jgi:PPOX class probable F420-dependent enzyme
MAPMSKKEIDVFLAEPRHAVLATTSVNRGPQLSPVWYVYREGALYVSTSDSSIKVRNLRRNPQMSVCVDGCRGDSRYVVLSGDAEFVANGTPLQQEIRWQIIRHYHDNETEARRYYESTRDESQILIVLKPARITSEDFN